MDPDGSNPSRISPDIGSFTWPIWSPDASTLVFSGVLEDEAGTFTLKLFAFNATTSNVSEVYGGEPGVVGLLADGVVHYPMWSPDSTKVAFVAITSEDLSLFIDDLTDSEGRVFVLDEGPLWMSWSPDSQHLLVHRGADHFLVNVDDEIRVDELDIDALGYRVPAWKPAGSVATLASRDDSGGYTILTAEVVADRLGAPRAIMVLREIGFPLAPAFVWSPSGEFLALAGSSRLVSYLGSILNVYRDLALISEDTIVQTLLIQDNVIAYFWSPDGSKLAYVTPSPTTGMPRWMVLNIDDGERWPLVDFEPSSDQLTMFQFFDQYAYSHSLWSPDSQSIVFAGRLADGASSVSAGANTSLQRSHIIVVGADPVPTTQTIANGTLGIWSPK